MTVNWQMDIGQILQVLVVIAAVIAAHFSLRGALNTFSVRLDVIEQRLAESVEMAREDMKATAERLKDHEDRMFELSGKLQHIIGSLDRRVQ